MASRQIVIVTYPGFQSLDVVGPMEVFVGAGKIVDHARAPGRPGRAPAYRVRVVSSTGSTVVSESGLAIGTEPLPSTRLGGSGASDGTLFDTVLVAGGSGVNEACRDDDLVDWLRSAAPHARRLATVCTGTFLAAEAGLLDGRTVTTHWARADRLAEEYPGVTVDADPIYTRAGNVWTSAGVTAGIDLALALVEDDHGTEVAQTVARWLVMFLRRPGGQTQFAAPVWMPRAERSSVLHVQQQIESNPSGDHRIGTLAAQASMSTRHFTRVFTDEVGEPPGQYVERVRTDAARGLLEATGESVTAIAARCGFGTAETMRRTFIRRVGVAPDHYRRRFGSAA